MPLILAGLPVGAMPISSPLWVPAQEGRWEHLAAGGVRLNWWELLFGEASGRVDANTN